MPARETLEKVFFWLLVVTLCGWFAAGWKKGALPPKEAILPVLFQEPVQTPTTRKEFKFEYRGVQYRVRPVAEYELWGLVVDHNDINAWWDIYHTADSVDTLDLGVIWGDNLKIHDYHRVKMWSGSWSINWQFPPGVTFSHAHIANNHLITKDPATRKKIATVRKGDQVRLRGILCDYQGSDNYEFWRCSSTTREDTGGTACEVVYVDSIEVLKAATPGWYLLYTVCSWGFAVSLLGRIALMFMV